MPGLTHKFLVVLAGLAALLCASCQSPILPVPPQPQVLVVAHRGCWGDAPENSLPALLECARLGVDIAEIDVQLTRDGVPVVLHDATLDRMTEGSGEVRSVDTSAFQALRLKAGDGGENAPLTDLHPPTLAQLLAARPADLMINLDVKDPAAYPAVNAMLRSARAGSSIILKSSMSPDSPGFEDFTRLNGARFMPVIRECETGRTRTAAVYCASSADEILRDFTGVDVYGYELIFRNEMFLADMARAAKGSQTRIWVNVLAPGHAAGRTDALALADPDGNWGRVADLGATIIQTDHPEALRAYLDRRAASRRPQP